MAKPTTTTRIIKKIPSKGKSKKHPNKKESKKQYVGQGR